MLAMMLASSSSIDQSEGEEQASQKERENKEGLLFSIFLSLFFAVNSINGEQLLTTF